MRPQKSFKQALKMVIHSKLRSWLTIIGIVIGVASVIAIVSLGDGMEASINDQLNDLGSDTLTLTAGASRAGGFGPGRDREGDSSSSSADEEPIGKKDLQILKGIPEIEYINTEIKGSANVYYLGEEGSVTISGIDQKVWTEFMTTDLEDGRYLDSADQNVVVIGSTLANDYFENEIKINKILTIEDKAFRVVGILDGSGKSVYMPISSAYEILDDSTKDEYDSLVMIIDENADIDLVQEKVEKKLMNSRHVTESDIDFSISSSAEMNEMRTEMMSTMNTFLTGIAAISLLVGAIGIANTMFTSVLEKTKQIGIMKAIGAKNGDILTIFLFNAGIIGFVGGTLGVLLGVGTSAVLGIVMSVDTIVTFSAVAAAMGVSVAVGIIAGIVPAYQGSKLKPVDALRYE